MNNSKLTTHSSQLAALVTEVLAANKYRHLDPGLVQHVGAQVLRSTPQLKAAVKETKSRLHQSAAAYIRTTPHYDSWLEQLRAVPNSGPRAEGSDWEALKPLCLRIMAQHASTYERIPHLERFYQAIFAALEPVSHVLDLGCGLNPLALPWMPLPQTVHYHACDVFSDMLAFVGAFFRMLGQAGHVFVSDLTQQVPEQRVDCVLALKLLPVLEQLKRGSALRLLEQLNSTQIIVSYPMQSLGGRNRGMAANYERQLLSMLSGKEWEVQRLDVAGELVFLIKKAL